jgi:hypothetical protein
LEQFLWGPNLDGSEGYLKMLTSALYDLKIDNNIYLRRFGEKGNDEFDEAAELLRTTEIDERKRRKYAIANHVGFILQVGDAMQKAFIRGGGIK